MPALPRIHLPVLTPEDVVRHLRGGEAQWREGYSAKAVAESWFAANDLPPSVRAVLDQAPEYRGAELIDAWRAVHRAPIRAGCGVADRPPCGARGGR